MNILFTEEKYFDEIVPIAYTKHRDEVKHHDCLPLITEQSFGTFWKEKSDGAHFVIGSESGTVIGYIEYFVYEDEKSINCCVPVWGSGAFAEKAEKTIGILFQSLAERLVKAKQVNFSFRFYANDLAVQRLFSYMQFGIEAEKCIRKVSLTDIDTKFHIREMPKTELKNRWSEVWNLLQKLIEHLINSPVFYPCSEFTEEVYSDFFTDKDTRVYVAESEGKIIGIIETNPEGAELFPHLKAANIGEAYVLPEYRGTGLARSLLLYAENEAVKNGVCFDWVEHGTANPTARGFWNKYFDTYEYEFIRSIKID